jgi:hypothetical protein
METNSIDLKCPYCNFINLVKKVDVLQLSRCHNCNEIICNYPILKNSPLSTRSIPNIDLLKFTNEHIDIRINGIKFLLSEIIDQLKIDIAKFTKVGFFAKKLLLPEKGDDIYFNKNSNVDLCNNQINIFPFFKIDSQNMWATSSYLYFNQSKLRKLLFQMWTDDISKSSMDALTFAFIEQFKLIYGNPTYCKYENDFIWQFKNSVFRCQISQDEKNVWFNWFYS